MLEIFHKTKIGTKEIVYQYSFRRNRHHSISFPYFTLTHFVVGFFFLVHVKCLSINKCFSLLFIQRFFLSDRKTRTITDITQDIILMKIIVVELMIYFY